MAEEINNVSGLYNENGESKINNGSDTTRVYSSDPQNNPLSIYLNNPLNNFDIYSYNIQIHQCHPKDVNDLEVAIADGRTVLLCDNSQESRYNITNMEQTFVLGHSQVRESFSNKFTIQVAEPNGATFLNALASSAFVNLGIEAPMQARYIMVVDFRGRDSSGRAVKLPQTFYYRIFFQNVEMQVTGDGSQYNITATEEAAMAYNYLENVIRSQITLECSTVGEFVAEFIKKHRRMLQLELDANPNQAFADTYEIEFDRETGTTEWLKWKIQQSDTGLKTLGPSRVGDKIAFNIPNGSNFTTIFGLILQSTAEYKSIQIASGGTMKPTPAEAANQTIAELPVFHKVLGHIEYGQYDPLRGDYVKNIVYKLKKHIVVDTPIDSIQYNSGITEPTIQNKRLSNIIQENLLRKRYDYIFTGLNTEVLNFDIKFNRAYYVMSVLGQGMTGDSNPISSTAGKSATTIETQMQEVKKRMSKLVREREKIINASKDKEGNIKQLDPPDEAAVQELQTNIEAQRSELEKLLEKFAERSKNRVKPDATFDSVATGDFIAASNAEQEVVQRLRFAADVVDDSDIYGPENDLEGGTIQFGAIKANLENSSDLMTIELHIKGDPYWLGAPVSFLRRQSDPELVDYEKGGPLFFLNMHLPIDENSAGRRVPRNDYRVSGLYRVQHVISQYKNGTFEQYLKAVRDPLTNTPTVLNRLLEAQPVTRRGQASLVGRVDNATNQENFR